MDAGAESMLARRPEGLALAEAVGLADHIEHPTAEGAAVWTRGVLRAMPRGLVMGVPTDLRALAASQVLSWRGLLRIPLDHVCRPTSVDGDVAIGSLVAARLGREVVDRLVEPLLGGVYAGHANEISLEAALPQLAGAVRVERSLLTAASRQVAGSADPGPLFATVRGGLGRLPLAVAERLRAAGVDIEHRVDRPWPDAHPRWLAGGRRGDPVRTATAGGCGGPCGPRCSCGPAALEGAAGSRQGAGRDRVCERRDRDRRPAGDRQPGTGRHRVPGAAGRGPDHQGGDVLVLEVGWVGAQDPARVVVRMSVGRHREEADLQRSDDQLAAVALADLARVTGFDQPPVDVVVNRWGGALPQYAVGHVDRVDRIRGAVEATSGLAVCGAAYDGVGVPACVASAERAAGQVLRGLGERRQWGHG